MKAESQEIIMDMMADRIKELEADLRYSEYRADNWKFMYDSLKAADKKQAKVKAGLLAKKRGPGRPKGSKNKVRK